MAFLFYDAMCQLQMKTFTLFLFRKKYSNTMEMPKVETESFLWFLALYISICTCVNRYKIVLCMDSEPWLYLTYRLVKEPRKEAQRNGRNLQLSWQYRAINKPTHFCFPCGILFVIINAPYVYIFCNSVPQRKSILIQYIILNNSVFLYWRLVPKGTSESSMGIWPRGYDTPLWST